MREEIANLVYPVLTHGLLLKKRLADNDDVPDVATAQNELQGLLQSAHQAQRWADFGGDHAAGQSIVKDTFLGIRYALVCWLDDIFILDSTWNEQWAENTLEIALYKTRDRAWKFWEQAEKAGARPAKDALEVFFLCAMLGFRGDKGNDPDDFKRTCERFKAQLDKGTEGEYVEPPAGQIRTNVPPLEGAARLQNMLTVAGVALLILVPILAFLLVRPGG